MSIERVRNYLSKWNLQDRIQEFAVSSATVELAAQALNVEGARIAKTLSYLVDGGAILKNVVVMPQTGNRALQRMVSTGGKN